MWNVLEHSVWHYTLRFTSSVVFTPFTPGHTLSHIHKGVSRICSQTQGTACGQADRNSCSLPCSAHQSSFVRGCSARPRCSNHIATPAPSTTFPPRFEHVPKRWQGGVRSLSSGQAGLKPRFSKYLSCQLSLRTDSLPAWESLVADQVLWSPCGGEINRVLHYYSLQQLTYVTPWINSAVVLWSLQPHAQIQITTTHTYCKALLHCAVIG